jgi:hypothetical protein
MIAAHAGKDKSAKNAKNRANDRLAKSHAVVLGERGLGEKLQ